MAELVPGFRMVALLGQGARSIIYHVIEEGTGIPRAIKRVTRRDPEDERFIEQVEIEYKVSHAIEHPNLRHSLALHRNKKWLQTNEVLLIMEFVQGKTLEQHRPNRLDHFLTIFRKVARGLDALHRSGHIHADMKPSNVIVGPQGVVKIIDFGQSCPIGHIKERIQGTPDFIAPEQVRRSTLDQRTDVYNLGATMYWVLTGANFPTELPAHLRSGIEMVKGHRPLSPREINEKFPMALSQLIMDCCKSNPKDRPGNMGQVYSRLELVQKMWRQKLAELRSSRRPAAAGASASATSDPAEAPGDVEIDPDINTQHPGDPTQA